LDLSSSALDAGDSRQYGLIAGSAIRNRWLGVLSTAFAYHPASAEVLSLVNAPSRGHSRHRPRLDHVGCHTSRSMRPRIWRRRASVK